MWQTVSAIDCLAKMNASEVVYCLKTRTQAYSQQKERIKSGLTIARAILFIHDKRQNKQYKHQITV